MAQIIKYCKKCFKDPYKYAKFISDMVGLEYQYVIENDSIGYFTINPEEDHEFCNYHPDEKLILSNLTSEEFHILNDICSQSSFIQAMEQLKESDPIEYQLKLSQFKSQLNQQESSLPKCPTCGSTNIEKISLTKKAVGGFMFGILSSDVRKTMHCKKCGYKW